MGDVKSLAIHRKGFELAMDIFHQSKSFPAEECYSLTGQIRRSSRAICVNIAEAYRKRNYPKYFLARITDADMENTETHTWLEFALACTYLDQDAFKTLSHKSEEIGRLLGHMLQFPEKYQSNNINRT